MSTKFTTRIEPNLLDKPLGLLLIDAQQWMSQTVLQAMNQRGLELTQAEFTFLANLDCGETHASSVARRMGISRQAVYRTTRMLSNRGLLTLASDPEKGNQKIIVMTEAGRQFISAARVCLEEVEEELARRIGREHTTALTTALSMLQDTP